MEQLVQVTKGGRPKLKTDVIKIAINNSYIVLTPVVSKKSVRHCISLVTLYRYVKM